MTKSQDGITVDDEVKSLIPVDNRFLRDLYFLEGLGIRIME